MHWQQNRPNPHSRNFQQRRDDELALQTLNFNQIELEFRKRVCIHFNDSMKTQVIKSQHYEKRLMFICQ